MYYLDWRMETMSQIDIPTHYLIRKCTLLYVGKLFLSWRQRIPAPQSQLVDPEKWAVLVSPCLLIGWAGAAVRVVSYDCTCARSTRSTCFTIRSHPNSNHLSSAYQRKCRAKHHGYFLILAGKNLTPKNTRRERERAGAVICLWFFVSFLP